MYWLERIVALYVLLIGPAGGVLFGYRVHYSHCRNKTKALRLALLFSPFWAFLGYFALASVAVLLGLV